MNGFTQRIAFGEADERITVNGLYRGLTE